MMDGDAPINRSTSGANHAPATPQIAAMIRPSMIACAPDSAAPSRIFFADAPRHHRAGGDAQSHGDREEQCEHRFGEADSGDGIRADVRHPEHVDHCEQRLHGHFENHGNREQHDGAADALLGEVTR